MNSRTQFKTTAKLQDCNLHLLLAIWTTLCLTHSHHAQHTRHSLVLKLGQQETQPRSCPHTTPQFVVSCDENFSCWVVLWVGVRKIRLSSSLTLVSPGVSPAGCPPNRDSCKPGLPHCEVRFGTHQAHAAASRESCMRAWLVVFGILCSMLQCFASWLVAS